VKLSHFALILFVAISIISCGPSQTVPEDTTPSSLEQPRSQDTPVVEAETPTTIKPENPQSPTASEPDTTRPTEEQGANQITPQSQNQQTIPASSPNQQPGEQRFQVPSTFEGQITSIRGSVQIIRDGRDLTNQADIGFNLFEYDLISTQTNGYLTAEFKGPGLSRATLSLKPNTKLYLEQSLLQSGGTRTTMQLLTGSVSINVQRLSGGQFGVNTQTSTLGVRGTKFDVILAPQLEVLITCVEGQVQVAMEDQASSAVPGRAITVNPDDGIAEYNVQVQNIARFQERWMEELLKEFEQIALPVARNVYRRWTRNLPRFRQEFARLLAQEALLNKWKSAIQNQKELGSVELLRDKRTITPILLNLKKIMFFMERDWAWLSSVRKDFPQAALGGDVGGISVQEFFRQHNEIQLELGFQFSKVREAWKTFSQISLDSPLGDFFGGSDR